MTHLRAVNRPTTFQFNESAYESEALANHERSDTHATRFIGCDVGKADIVVFDSATGRTRRLPNEPQALAAFAATLEATCLVICEATGGYEAALLQALVDVGRPAHRADARKVKAFIRSLGTLGKTDAIDAKALAHTGRSATTGWRSGARDELHTLVTTRSDLVRDRVAFANRLAAPCTAPVAARLRRLPEASRRRSPGSKPTSPR